MVSKFSKLDDLEIDTVYVFGTHVSVLVGFQTVFVSVTVTGLVLVSVVE